MHLGAFLLLRISPLLDLSPVLCAATVTLGLSTALLAALVGRVQTDIKGALAFASLTQVGLIVAEIGFGFRYFALIHIFDASKQGQGYGAAGVAALAGGFVSSS